MSARKSVNHPDATLATFEQHRGLLKAVAYRLLGTMSDAEDIVQETYLRWAAAQPAAVTQPKAYLTRITTRLCLDYLKSARVRREKYVGQWLPEPVVQEAEWVTRPAKGIADDISYALMLALERLSPLERAAFLLHDVFGVAFEEIATTLKRPAATCRRLASRARTNVRAARPRFSVKPDDGERIAAQFMHAVETGDASALTAMLAEDAVFVADGGERAIAVRKPILGRERILRLLTSLARRFPAPDVTRLVKLNGQPGFVKYYAQYGLSDAYVLEIKSGRVAVIYVVRNPDKLKHLSTTL